MQNAQACVLDINWIICITEGIFTEDIFVESLYLRENDETLGLDQSYPFDLNNIH